MKSPTANSSTSGNALALMLVVGLGVAAIAFWYYRGGRLPSRPLIETEGVTIPILTGTRWEARDSEGRTRMFDIVFKHGDQRQNHRLDATVITSSPHEAKGGTYDGLKLKFDAQVSGGVSKFTARINPTNTGEMNGKFTGKLGDRKFQARENWTDVPR